LNGLANILVTRWASTPNLQSVVCATFCELLQIPADDTQGMSKWLLINKVVTEVASGYKEILQLEDVDLKQLAMSVFNSEVSLKQELEGSVGQINTLNARLLIFEKEAEALRKKNEELTSRLILNETIVTTLENNLLERSAKLFDTEKKLKIETDTVAKQQKTVDDATEKLIIAEKLYREKVAEEKLLLIKLEEIEKFPPSPLTKKPLSTASSSAPEPPLYGGFNPDPTLSKEEMRMFKAINRVTTSPGGLPIRTRSISGTQRVVDPEKIGSITSPHKAGAGTRVYLMDTLPDWKRRQLEKERAEQEKFELEQQKKLEALQSHLQSGSRTSEGSSSDSLPVLETDVISLTLPHTSFSDLSETEKEELRLTRVLNKRPKT